MSSSRNDMNPKETIIATFQEWLNNPSVEVTQEDIKNLNDLSSQLHGDQYKKDRKAIREKLMQLIKARLESVEAFDNASNNSRDDREAYRKQVLAFFVLLWSHLHLLAGIGSANYDKKQILVDLESAIVTLGKSLSPTDEYGPLIFYIYVTKNRLDEVKSVLALADDETKTKLVQYRDPTNGATPLLIAARWRFTDLARVLLTVPGVDVNATFGKYRISVLQCAAYSNSSKIVSMLLKNPETKVYYCDERGVNASGMTLNVGIGSMISKAMNAKVNANFEAGMAELDQFKNNIDSDYFKFFIKRVNRLSPYLDNDLVKADSRRVKLRSKLVAVFEGRVQELLNNPNNTVEELRRECAFLEVLRDKLKLIKGRPRENTAPKTSMIAIKGLIEKLELKIAEKSPKQDVKDVCDAIMFISHPSKDTSQAMPALMTSYFLSSDRALVNQARLVMAKLSPDQKKRVKEKLFAHVQGVAADYKSYFNNDHWIYVLSRDCQDASNKKVLFEIFRTGDNKKVDYDTGTWIKFVSLMKNGNFLKLEPSKDGGRGNWFGTFSSQPSKEQEMTDKSVKSKSPSPDGKSGQ